MRVVVAGSSGFLGTALRDRLARDGHEVFRLVRGPAGTPTESRWDPYAGEVDDDLIGSADVVVNLAGAALVRWPWSASYKQALLDSRVRTTDTIATAIARTGGGTTLVNGSGIDAYGHPGNVTCDERSPFGNTFLAGVVERWEAATTPAAEAGARVVWLRTAGVLHRGGGLLPLVRIPFRLGVGGRIGSGRQWFPFVSLDDWLGATMFLIDRADVSGPFNLVAPEPATNAEFTRALAGALHRPAAIPVPAAAVRLVTGDMSGLILGSLKAVPRALGEAGYEFAHPDVETAVRAAGGR